MTDIAWTCSLVQDNVETRLFLDEQCCRHGVALVDAGTQGLLASTQVTNKLMDTIL